MDNNSVHLIGNVKRSAESGEHRGMGVLDFAISVWNDESRRFEIFDCRATSMSAAYKELEGFVTEGERLEIVGHLEKQTSTDRERIAGAMVEVRLTKTIILVDDVLDKED